MNTIQQEDKQAVKSFALNLILWIIVACIWALLGLVAFIWSIVCFFKTDHTALNLVGLLLAVLFGPFYWLYFLFVKQYCRKQIY